MSSRSASILSSALRRCPLDLNSGTGPRRTLGPRASRPAPVLLFCLAVAVFLHRMSQTHTSSNHDIRVSTFFRTLQAARPSKAMLFQIEPAVRPLFKGSRITFSVRAAKKKTGVVCEGWAHTLWKGALRQPSRLKKSIASLGLCVGRECCSHALDKDGGGVCGVCRVHV